MSRPPLRLAPRPDESLYSVLARFSATLGTPPRAELDRAIYGANLRLYDDLPVGLDRLVARGWTDRGVEAVVLDLTLFPYHAAFVEDARRMEALAAMRGDGPWPHGVLRSWRPEAMPAASFRFCPACMDEMLSGRLDAWWRRSHQLPTVLVCPEHGEPLRESRVDRKARGSRYVVAGPASCPGDSPAGVDCDADVYRLLLWLARRSVSLLPRGPVSRLKVRDGYLSSLGASADGAAAVDLKRLAAEVVAFWAGVLDLRPDWSAAMRGPRWIEALLYGFNAPPLHHLLLQGWLERDFAA